MRGVSLLLQTLQIGPLRKRLLDERRCLSRCSRGRCRRFVNKSVGRASLIPEESRKIGLRGYTLIPGIKQQQLSLCELRIREAHIKR